MSSFALRKDVLSRSERRQSRHDNHESDFRADPMARSASAHLTWRDTDPQAHASSFPDSTRPRTGIWRIGPDTVSSNRTCFVSPGLNETAFRPQPASQKKNHRSPSPAYGRNQRIWTEKMGTEKWNTPTRSFSSSIMFLSFIFLSSLSSLAGPDSVSISGHSSRAAQIQNVSRTDFPDDTDQTKTKDTSPLTLHPCHL